MGRRDRPSFRRRPAKRKDTFGLMSPLRRRPVRAAESLPKTRDGERRGPQTAGAGEGDAGGGGGRARVRDGPKLETNCCHCSVPDVPSKQLQRFRTSEVSRQPRHRRSSSQACEAAPRLLALPRAPSSSLSARAWVGPGCREGSTGPSRGRYLVVEDTTLHLW